MECNLVKYLSSLNEALKQRNQIDCVPISPKLVTELTSAFSHVHDTKSNLNCF